MNFSSNFSLNATISAKLTSTEIFGYLTIPLIFIGTLGSTASFILIRVNYISLQSSMISLLKCLSIATIFFAGFSFPVNAYTMIKGTPNFFSSKSGKQMCQATAFIYYYSESVCAYSHASIALNRLLMVVLARKCAMIGQKVTTAILICFTWLVPLLIFGYPLGNLFAEYGYIVNSNRCAIKSAKPGYVLFYKLAYSIIPFVIICFCYSTVVIFVKSVGWTKFRQVPAEGRNKTANKLRETAKQLISEKREKRLTRIAFMTCLAFMIGYLPNALLGLVGNLGAVQSSTGTIVMLWMQLGCVTNPIIYILLSARSRRLNEQSQPTANSMQLMPARPVNETASRMNGQARSMVYSQNFASH